MHYKEFENRLGPIALAQLPMGTVVEIRLRQRLASGRLDQIGQTMTATVESKTGSSTLKLRPDTIDGQIIKIPLIAFSDQGLGYLGQDRLEMRIL